MARLLKFDEVPVSGKAFNAQTYRQFFVTDDGGPIGLEVYTKGAERYEKGYSVCRIAEAKPNKKAKRQPEHYHPERYPFVIVGIKGKRIMEVGGKRFTIVPGTILQIGKGEHHRTLNLANARYVTLEMWQSTPRDDEVMVSKGGEESVVNMIAEGKIK